MILRRLGVAVRNQDWLTVAIEFSLIITSVLLALQVNNWNEARRNEARLVGALERLDSEVRANIQIADDMIEVIGEQQAERDTALEVLVACVADDARMHDFNSGISSTIRDFAPSFVDTSFNELLQRDELLDLLSSDFREDMGAYRGRLSEDQDQFNTNFSLMWMDHIITNPLIGVELSEDENAPPIVLSVPIEEACIVPRFQVQLLTTVSFIRGLGLRAERFVDESEAFLQAIEGERQLLAGRKG